MEYLPYLIGGTVTLAGGLIIAMLKRLFRANDLLFAKYDQLNKRMSKLQACLIADPSKTAIFEALMSDDEAKGF